MKKIILLFIMSIFVIGVVAQNYTSTLPQNKNAILEEFTGVSCPNCPAGHTVMAGILAANPDRAFCVAYHPSNSSYTTPYAGDPDFRRTYANVFYSTPYCGSSRFMPSSFIARRQWANGERIQSRGEWSTYANTIMSEASPANMGLSTTYDFVTHMLYITVEIYYTEDMTDANNVYVYLSENDLVSQQSGATGQYTHKHTFRESFVAQWGDPITSPTTQGSLVTLEFEWDATGSDYIMSNCEVLAFIENQTDDEIITGVGVHVGESTYIEPTADFSVDNNYVGVGQQAVFTDESTGNPTAWEWTFEGGDPATSDLQSPPPVTYNTAGQYGVTLTVTNPAGNNTMTMTNFMDIGYPPQAEFTASNTMILVGESIDFMDNSAPEATSWLWDFAGGTPATSTDQNPTITYNTIGDYDVSLTASNEYGETILTKTAYIHVGNVGIAEQYARKAFAIYPNPCSDKLFIEARKAQSIEQISVRSINGQEVLNHSPENGSMQTIDLSSLKSGLYFVEIRTEGNVYLEKVMVK